MSSTMDEVIIQAVLAGGKQAFGELIQAYWGMVYGIAYDTLADPMLAEDRSQEIFLQAFLNLRNLKSLKSFRHGSMVLA